VNNRQDSVTVKGRRAHLTVCSTRKSWTRFALPGEEWEAEHVQPTVDRFGERRETFETDTRGREVDRLYTPEDVANAEYEGKTLASLARNRTRAASTRRGTAGVWTMRQYAGMGTAGETNERFNYLLDEGQTGLSMAFDLPTQMGHDSDDALAVGEVGKTGVAIDSLRDMETVFEGIPLDDVSTSMTINAPASVLLAMYVAIGDQQGVPARNSGAPSERRAQGYIARNTYIYPPEPSMRIITDIFEFCAAEVPNFNTISISGYHIREAGSTAAQEIAFTLADGIEYVEAAIDAGLDVDEFAPSYSFFFASYNNILEEVAKFRAARRLWADLMDERFDAADPKSKQLKFHTQTAGSTLTAQRVENNVVRVAYQALAAVLGGTQSLHTNGKDEGRRPPDGTERPDRPPDPADPRPRIRRRRHRRPARRELLRRIADRRRRGRGPRNHGRGRRARRHDPGHPGPVGPASDPGRRLRTTARTGGGRAHHRRRQRVHRRRGGAPSTSTRSTRARRNASESGWRPSRTSGTRRPSRAKLDALREAAESDENLMPSLVDAVKVYATTGECCDVLRDVFGEYQPGSAL